MTVYIQPLKDKHNITWKGAAEVDVLDYSISESGFREKTASFTTVQHFDLTEGVYLVLITSPYHENFSGFLLSEDYKAKDKTYSYKCKDLHMLYNTKFTKTYKRATGRDILIDALTWGERFGKHTKKSLKSYARQLNGLFKDSKYEMLNYGYRKRFNPMTKRYKNQKIQNKSCWEVIKAYTIGTGAYLDLQINDYGTIIINPFNVKSFNRPSMIITDVGEDLSLNTSTEGLIELSGGGNIFNINYKEERTSDDTAKTTNDGNPYHCKNKEIWINMDEWRDNSHDWNYLNNLCKELEKLGWKTHKIGIDPHYCSSVNDMLKAKDGMYLTIDNGMDTDVIREYTYAPYFAGKAAANNVLLGLFFVPPADRSSSFLKGGKRYSSLEQAWDGTGAGGSLSYPASHMAKAGTPFGFCNTDNPKEMANLINKGGDSPKACNNNFFKISKPGFYHNAGDKNYGY